MKKSKISVVLGSYNRLKFLRLTIDSIREEIKDLNSEIIIVDGGSDDGTLEWLVSQKDIITIVQHNRGEWLGEKIERKSWGYFMNLGFKCAQGKYVCMLSDDCLVIPGAIKEGYKLFEEKLNEGEKIGAVAFYFRDWSQQEQYHVGYTLGNNLYVNHGIYLKQALEDVDYIDEETFFFYNGDGDLCLKMWQKGYKVIDCEKSFIEHYPHANLKVRKSNYKKQRLDDSSYFKKWENVFYNKKENNVGGIKYKSYLDSFNTANKFKTIHDDIVLSNPKILKKKKKISSKLVSIKFRAKKLLRKYF